MKKQLFEIVKECPIVKDSSEAFRLIVQGAVKVDGNVENEINKELNGGEKITIVKNIEIFVGKDEQTN